MRALIRFWRRLLGRCALCGSPRELLKKHDLHTHGPYCRRCNKSHAFATNYGMSLKRVEEKLFARLRRGPTVIAFSRAEIRALADFAVGYPLETATSREQAAFDSALRKIKARRENDATQEDVEASGS